MVVDYVGDEVVTKRMACFIFDGFLNVVFVDVGDGGNDVLRFWHFDGAHSNIMKSMISNNEY